MVKKLSNSRDGNTILDLHTSDMRCCNSETLSTKSYSVPLTSTQVVQSITVKVGGVNQVLNLAASTSGFAAVRKELAKLFKSVGYDPYHDDAIKGIVTQNNRLTINGELEVVSVTVAGTATTPTVKNSIKGFSTFYARFPSSVTAVVVNGLSSTIDTTSATTLKNSLVSVFGGRVVVVPAASGTYDVNIEALTSNAIYFGTVQANPVSYFQKFD